MSFAVTDAVGNVLHSALNGLAMRQSVIADNIANVDTPGFRARSVDFETALTGAIEQGRIGSVTTGVSVTPTDTPVGANDNNVDLRKESIAAIQTQFQYQIMGRAVTDRAGRMSTMIGGGM